MSNQVQKQEKTITAKVLTRVTEMKKLGSITLPSDYSVENALQSAYLVLEQMEKGNKSILDVCTEKSISQALLKMVTMGLNPDKKQCYFIPYGNVLSLSVSYNGNVANAKRHGLRDINSQIINQDDEFETKLDEFGVEYVVKHVKPFENRDKPIIGAYAIVIMEDGTVKTTIMTMQDIKNAWNQGAAKGNSPAHKNFPGEMARKTVEQRAVKRINATSSDSHLYDDHIEVDNSLENKVKIVENEIKEDKIIEIDFDESEDELANINFNEETGEIETEKAPF